jgi:hypothetical protein
MLATQVYALTMGFRVSVCEKLHAVLFLDHVCTISQPVPIQNELLCPDHHLDVPEVWMKQFSKGTNIGSNNLHPSLDFGDSVLMPKLAKRVSLTCLRTLYGRRWKHDWVVIWS